MTLWLSIWIFLKKYTLIRFVVKGVLFSSLKGVDSTGSSLLLSRNIISNNIIKNLPARARHYGVNLRIKNSSSISLPPSKAFFVTIGQQRTNIVRERSVAESWLFGSRKKEGYLRKRKPYTVQWDDCCQGNLARLMWKHFCCLPTCNNMLLFYKLSWPNQNADIYIFFNVTIVILD